MNKSMRHEGGCLCAAVRYVAEGKPLRIGVCHCLDCRKTSGSAYSYFAIFPRRAFCHTGDLSTYNGRSFCPQCGSRVVNLTDEEAEVMVGTFDRAPTDVMPEYELWVHRREKWMHRLPWADQFDKDRTEAGGDWRESLIP